MDARSSDISLSLPPELRDFVLERVAFGDFPSPADYVRQLIQADQKQRALAELDRLLIEGLESGPPIDATPEFWETLEREMLERRRAVGEP